MRVIFDRSAFHGRHFEELKQSALRRLVVTKQVVVFHTPVFLDETVATYGSGREWRDHLLYAVDICNGGIFLEKEVIWRNELVVGRGPYARHLLPQRPNKRYDSAPRLLSTLRQKAESGDLSKEWRDAATERAEARLKKANQRTLHKGARATVAEALREGRVLGKPRDLSFSAFRSRELIDTGRLLMDLVDGDRAGALADQWAIQPHRFPYYGAFVEGLLYAWYYAAVEHNERIDMNAQADYEQLAHLIWADMVVSNEQGFLRKAFETLWRPRGKRIETTQGFAALMSRLSSLSGDAAWEGPRK